MVALGIHSLTRPAAAPAPLVVGDGRSVILTGLDPPATDALLRRVATEIGPAVVAVENFWGTDWAHTIRIVATGSPEQFAAQAGTGAAGRRPDTAAVTVADRVDPVHRTVDGQRMVLAPGAAAMSDAALRIVLGHELFHYAARADTALDAPRWVVEGVADYVGRPAPSAPVPIDTATLPADTDFTGSATELSAAYDRAWLFSRFLADEFGPPALRDFYLRVAGVQRQEVAAALVAVFGAGPAEILASWQRWAADR